MPLYGQTKAEIDREEAELKAYRLNMDKVRRLGQAQRNVLQLLKSDVAVVNALKAQERAARDRDDDGASNGGRLLIAKAQRRLEAHPKVVAVVRSAGFDAREYVMANWAFAMAAAADFALKHGDKKFADTLPPQNLQLIRQNEAELKTLTEEMQRMTKEFEAVINPQDGNEGPDQDKEDPEEKPAPKSRKK
jgi:hypothetical protein